MIDSSNTISIPKCLIDPSYILDDESNEIDFFNKKSEHQFLKDYTKSNENELDNLWLFLLKSILIGLAIYSLLIMIYRFIRVINQFKRYKKFNNENSNQDNLDNNNNEINNNSEIKNYNQINNEIILKSTKTTGRISPQIRKLNKNEIDQVKFISIIILVITLIIIILEIIILSLTNNLILIIILTFLNLLSMICKKNNFDPIGLINLLIYLINLSMIVLLTCLNRFNFYKGRRKSRRYSLQQQQ